MTNKRFFRCDDYYVFSEEVDGVMEYSIIYYFIKPAKGEKSPLNHTSRVERITEDLFLMYCNDFRKPYRRHKNIIAKIGTPPKVSVSTDCPTDYPVPNKKRGFNVKKDVESAVMDKIQLEEIDHIVAQCSEKQQRRFESHFYAELSMREIAVLEGCDVSSVSESIGQVVKKIKNFYKDTPNT
jgi:hypothetical protein